MPVKTFMMYCIICKEIIAVVDVEKLLCLHVDGCFIFGGNGNFAVVLLLI